MRRYVTVRRTCSPQKRFSRGGWERHLIHGSLDPHKSVSQKGISIGSADFVQLTGLPRNTDHATSDICSNRPHLMHCLLAMRPKI